MPESVKGGAVAAPSFGGILSGSDKANEDRSTIGQSLAPTTPIAQLEATGSAILAPAPPAAPKIVKRTKPLQLPALPGAKNIKAYGTLLLVTAIACFLWFGDGFFTLVFLEGWAPAIQRILEFKWLIPWGITVGTLHLWPTKAKWQAMIAARRRWAEDGSETSQRKYLKQRNRIIFHSILFLTLIFLNIGTSTQGIAELAAGRQVNLFGGMTLPAKGSTGLLILSSIGGFIGAFGPEKLLRWVQDEFSEL